MCVVVPVTLNSCTLQVQKWLTVEAVCQGSAAITQMAQLPSASPASADGGGVGALTPPAVGGGGGGGSSGSSVGTTTVAVGVFIGVFTSMWVIITVAYCYLRSPLRRHHGSCLAIAMLTGWSARQQLVEVEVEGEAAATGTGGLQPPESESGTQPRAGPGPVQLDTDRLADTAVDAVQGDTGSLALTVTSQTLTARSDAPYRPDEDEPTDRVLVL